MCERDRYDDRYAGRGVRVNVLRGGSEVDKLREEEQVQEREVKR